MKGLKPNFHFHPHHDGMAVSLDHDFDADMGSRHQFFNQSRWYNGPFMNLTCLDCHARGAWKASFDVKLHLIPFGNRKECKNLVAPGKRSAAALAFHEEHADMRPLVYAYMEAERIGRHRADYLQVQRLRKRGEMDLPMLLDPRHLSCDEDDSTFPVCHEDQLPRELHERSMEEEIGRCNQFERPIRSVGKTLWCFGKWLAGHGKGCEKKWAHDLKEVVHGGLKAYMKGLVKTHLEHVEITLEVVKPIDLRFQVEAASTVGTSFWFDVDLGNQEIALCPKGYPIGGLEDPIFCYNPQLPVDVSYGWFTSFNGGSPTGTVLSSLPVGRKKDEHGNDLINSDGKKEWEKLSHKMTPAKYKGKTWPTPKDQNMGQSNDLSADKEKAEGYKKSSSSTNFFNKLPLPTLDLTPIRIDLSLLLTANINAYVTDHQYQ